jgi:exoribonuclease R
MKNTIYTHIQKNLPNSFNFDELFKHFSSTNKDLTKQSFGAFLRELENDGLVAEIDKKLVDLTQFPEQQGFVHWNLNQLAWIEPEDNTNDYGIAFNLEENLTTILNKKKAFYGTMIKGRLIANSETDRTSIYITETISQKELSLFAVYRKEFNYWSILNSAGNFKIKGTELNSKDSFEDGDVYLLKKNTNLEVNVSEKIGNISDKGIESKIIQSLAHVYKTTEDNKTFNFPTIKQLDKPFFSIDGIGTKDIDDAIWIEKNETGYNLWVAISDVSSFVKVGDNQDIHAQDKCTSFYFLNDTVHMLSRDLAENYCSLNPGAPKLAMVCALSYDLSGNLLNYEFQNREIKSHARLTYDDVDSVLNDGNPNDSLIYKDGYVSRWYSSDEPGTQWLKNSLKTFEEFSNLLSKEYKPDYWFVPSSDLSIGADGKVDHLYIDNRDGTQSQKIVETSMLAANKAAAQFLCESYPYIGLFRNQNAPKQEFERPKPAFYHADNEGHWGLQTEFYTHFTSPIRRFCDLVAHRLIKDVIYKNDCAYDKQDIQDIVEKINFQQYVARQCSNREKNLLMNQYLQKLVNNKELQVKFRVVDFNENGVVIRNNQLIENYIPKFKLDRNISSVIDKFDYTNLAPSEKEKIVNELNDTWKIKCFIDNYHWLDDRKETTYKFYKRDFTEEMSQDRKVNATI